MASLSTNSPPTMQREKWNSSAPQRIIRSGISVGEDVSIEDLERDFDAIFIGIGLGSTQPLGITGEKLSHVVNALEFIAAYKHGQPMPVGHSIAVIGGGNTAIDVPLRPNTSGASHVSILYRRAEGNMSAFTFEYEHARHAGVNFVWNARPSPSLPTPSSATTVTSSLPKQSSSRLGNLVFSKLWKRFAPSNCVTAKSSSIQKPAKQPTPNCPAAIV